MSGTRWNLWKHVSGTHNGAKLRWLADGLWIYVQGCVPALIRDPSHSPGAARRTVDGGGTHGDRVERGSHLVLLPLGLAHGLLLLLLHGLLGRVLLLHLHVRLLQLGLWGRLALRGVAGRGNLAWVQFRRDLCSS